MTSPISSPQSAKKQTTVHSVRLEYVHVDLNGGMSNVSLTMTLKLEYTSRTQGASLATVSQQ